MTDPKPTRPELRAVGVDLSGLQLDPEARERISTQLARAVLAELAAGGGDEAIVIAAPAALRGAQRAAFPPALTATLINPEWIGRYLLRLNQIQFEKTMAAISINPGP